MKKILILAFLFSVAAHTFAQHTYSFTILDTKMLPKANVEVVGRNTASGTELKSKTDIKGTAVFTLSEPGVYSFSYLEMKDVATYNVAENSTGKGTKTITYDPAKVFSTPEKCNRKGLTFKTATPTQLKGQPTAATVNVEARDKSGTLLPNLSIVVLDVNDKVKYKGVTNSVGIAAFYLSAGHYFEIDVETVEALKVFVLPNYPGSVVTVSLNYEKTNVEEIASSDTIVQHGITQTNGSSTHLLFTVTLNNYDDEPLANEDVFVDAQNSKKVYRGKTDADGQCKFMLEKGAEYLVNLKYDRGVYLVDAPNNPGFGSAYIQRRYRGSAEIERMMAEQKINELGFVVNHSSTPVIPAKTPFDYITKTEKGFDIDFQNSGPVGTPTIVEDKLLTQEGFYSPNFYCLDAITGKYLWGFELGESGMSPIVYHDGVLLINTYSCTLYAFDVRSGSLLWSKWLAGTIYSTPSADSSSVYVVYNNGKSNPKSPDESFVLTSFDLRTGNMNWINWIDNEVIACPVVEGQEVHVASQSGNYYVFDKNDGKQVLVSKTVKAVSSPTITPNSIYLTALVNGKEKLVVLDRKTLKINRTYTAQLNSNKITENRDCYSEMNFNGSHPIVYKNNIVIIADSAKLTAFDANSERILWQKPVKIHANQIPVIANDQVVVATTTGEIISYNINTGVPQITKAGDGEIDGQIVVHDGFMYVAIAGVISVIKTNLNHKWVQWNKDGGHNLIFK
jgi:outer membrane protein assembly factor BamB